MLGDRGGRQWLAVTPLCLPTWKPETTVRDNVPIFVSEKPLYPLTRLQDNSSCVYGNYTMFPLATSRNVCGWVCSWFVIRHYEVDDPAICGRCRVKGRIIMVLYPTTGHKVSFESLSALGASSGPAAAIDQPAQQIYYDDITIIFCSEGIKSALTLVLKILFTVSVLLEDLDWESVYIVKVINDAQLKAVLAWFHIIIVAER